MSKKTLAYLGMALSLTLGILIGSIYEIWACGNEKEAALSRQEEVIFESSLKKSYGTMVVFAKGQTQDEALLNLQDRLNLCRTMGWQTVGEPIKGEYPYGVVTFEQVISRFP